MKFNKSFLALAAVGLLAVTVSCGGKASTPGVTEEAGSVANVENLDSTMIKVKDGLVIPEGVPVVIDFNATWCGPCQNYAPIFHSVAESEQYAGKVVFLSIDTDQYPEIANRYEIQSIPTTVFVLPGGGVMGKEGGVLQKQQLETYINQLLEQVAGEGDAI